jgi:hypothetical protein
MVVALMHWSFGILAWRFRGRDGGGDRDEGAEDDGAHVLPVHGGWRRGSGVAARPGSALFLGEARYRKMGCADEGVTNRPLGI